MFRVLVTNDDGIESIGLTKLVKELSKLAIVYVVAPNGQQSAKSMSLTTNSTITADEIDMEGAEVAYSLDGTPADCVKWGLGRFQGLVGFDYVVSGINRGYNLGSATLYSGTVGAAREGALSGLKSIALSVEHHDTVEFDYICSILDELFEMSDRLGEGSLLNVNAPDIPSWKVKGLKIVEAAQHSYGDCYEFVSEGDGFKLEPYYSENDPKLENDYNLLTAGYVTATPLSVQLTDTSALRKLQGLSTEDSICVFMDAQVDTVDTMYKPKRWRTNIIKWAKCVNRLDFPVLITEQHGNGETLPEITDGVANFETVIRVGVNATDNKEFNALLSSASNRDVYLAGLETHVGIQQTALSMLEQGYKVTIVEDCCTAKTKHDHEIAIENLRAFGCRITTFDAIFM